MTRIAFRDVRGQVGRISDDLEVSYGGEWRGEIEACIERIDDEQPADQVYDHIVVELPEETPVDGVERLDPVERDDG